MPSKAHLTHADRVYVGAGVFAPIFHVNERKGVPVDFPTKISLGSPIAAVATALIANATGAQLPNANTVSYTTAGAGVAPQNDAALPSATTLLVNGSVLHNVFPLDVPRNLYLTATHATSIVAMTATITGFDVYGQKMVEILSLTATGTSKAVNGNKAFKYIESIAMAAAGDATANTVSIGFGNKLGLPYALQAVADVLRSYFNDAADTATIVKADATTATALTGDVRGTLTPGSACNGSEVVIWYHIGGRQTEIGLRGFNQYAG